MKIKLLFLLLFGVFCVNAQTTWDIDWQIGTLSPTTDRTINLGDIVRWTWRDSAPHSVRNLTGLEVFSSTVLTGAGMQYSYTFTVIGSHPYECGVHLEALMSGIITVLPSLSIDDFDIRGFSISPNPASYKITLQIPEGLINVKVKVFDVLGKEIYNNVFTEAPINISDWSNGVYFVRVSSDNAVHTKRFIKQ
jgi:Secretion system C-terminal sorting domain